ncbi:MAG: 50S ribosomal protein L35 [Planctomycetes bacterium]|nr:50S ribosomal protein L35 [Planctomycetota bacterium]
MPKQKTKKSLKKRMWLTKSGKVRHFKAGTGHMQVAKRSKRRRMLRRAVILPGKMAQNARKMLGA